MSHKHISFKRYGHERGLSCCFRQWSADSHCQLLHGYALAVEFEFHSETLDYRNWVMDFGSLKPVEKFLRDLLDHTLLVANDDPQKDELCALSGIGLANVIVLPNVGCEALAEHIFQWVNLWAHNSTKGRVSLHKVIVNEHGANGAGYVR